MSAELYVGIVLTGIVTSQKIQKIMTIQKQKGKKMYDNLKAEEIIKDEWEIKEND